MLRQLATSVLRSKTSKVSGLSSLTRTSKRHISFVATPTNPPTEAGHTNALFSLNEMALKANKMGAFVGWNGYGRSLSQVGKTSFIRDNDKHQSFSLDDPNATGEKKVFSGIHNTGRFDVAPLPEHKTTKALLPDLNEQGMTAVQGVRDRHASEGIQYMTTHKTNELAGKRTRNCVGYNEEVLKAISGVDLGLHPNAYPEDFVRAVNANRAVIQKGMHYSGSSDDTSHEAIPWVRTKAEDEYDNALAKRKK